jgi:hypothetical protein
MEIKLSQEEIKEKILNLESQYPVDKWLINGIYVWPYIRIKIYIYLLNYGSITALNDINKSKKKIGKVSFIFRKLAYPFQFIIALLKLMYFYNGLKPKKIVFFGSHIHRANLQDGYFNRFFDSMIDTYRLQDEVYIVEFQKVFKKNYNQKAIIPLHRYLNHYKLIRKISSKGKYRKNNVELKEYEDFHIKLIKEFPTIKFLNISKENLIKWVNKINNTKGFFYKLFEKTRPSKIIFLSYYGFDDLSAAILAAHNLGIKTIDFQHGPQTNVHMAYSYWTKHPERPYNIMPIEYWNWDHKSKENIDKWAEKTNKITAKVVGQPYLGYCLNNQKLYKDGVPFVFFSLQTFEIEEMISPKLIILINNSSFHWILRMHPRSNFGEQELRTFLESSGAKKSNYNIHNSFDNPLPETLSQAVVHLTNFSGCLLEAQMIGIPTILIHETGKQMFRNYIDDIMIFYLNQNDIEFENNFKIILKNLKNEKDDSRKLPVVNPLKVK